MAYDVFISYRRKGDVAPQAKILYAHLCQHLGASNVFMDVGIRSGVQYAPELESRLTACKVLLAVIGKAWINVTDERGVRRLDDPNDWVRYEIAKALRRNIPVIPILIDGAPLPALEYLPVDLQGILRHQAAPVSMDRFTQEAGDLERDIRKIIDPYRIRSAARGTIIPWVMLATVAVAAGTYWMLQRQEDRTDFSKDKDAWLTTETRTWRAPISHGRVQCALEVNAQARRFCEQGVVFAQAGSHDKAIAAFGDALRLSGNYLDALHWRGASYLQKGDRAAALADFDRLIQLDKTNADVYVQRAAIRLAQNDPESALKDLQAALVNAPSDQEALKLRGVALAKMGDNRQALEDLNQAIVLDPADVHSYISRGV